MTFKRLNFLMNSFPKMNGLVIIHCIMILQYMYKINKTLCNVLYDYKLKIYNFVLYTLIFPCWVV